MTLIFSEVDADSIPVAFGVEDMRLFLAAFSSIRTARFLILPTSDKRSQK